MRALHQDIGKPRASHNDRAGSALLAVLGVSLILMLAGGTMVVLSGQSMHRVKHTADYAQARAVAEAGIADMVAKLGTNYTFWQNTANYTATFFSNGSYHVTTQLQTNGNVLITSDGVYMGITNQTIMELLGTLQTHYNELYDPNSAIMSGGEIEIEAGSILINGNIGGNNNVETEHGTHATISGNVAVVGSADTNGLYIVGTVSTGAPPITIPPTGPFNFDSYRQMATNGGVYLEGNRSLSGSPIWTPAPTNGILYVNGNLTINNLSTFSGTIVVNGNISIKNQFTQTPFPGSSNMPSLLSTGNIELENHVTLNGVVYARVELEIENYVTINGGVIAGGETEISNHITLNYGLGYPVWDPLNPEVPPVVIAGGWLK